MDGFVLLERETGPGDVWVRRADIVAVELLHVRSIEGAWSTVSVLAGCTWFRDRTTYPTEQQAEARAAELAGVGVGSSWRSRLVAAARLVRGGR